MDVVNPREVCPRCDASMVKGPRWDDPSQSLSARKKKLRATNIRMRNSGAMLFVVGIILMSRGVDSEANSLSPFGAIGVLCIIFGTIIFLWGWKLLQMRK
jgi:predicted nucleic acid-binding Zn ribbon protein